MSSVRHIDPGIMCDKPDCLNTVYASQVDRRSMAGLVSVLRSKGWKISERRGDQALDLCPDDAKEEGTTGEPIRP